MIICEAVGNRGLAFFEKKDEVSPVHTYEEDCINIDPNIWAGLLQNMSQNITAANVNKPERKLC